MKSNRFINVVSHVTLVAWLVSVPVFVLPQELNAADANKSANTTSRTWRDATGRFSVVAQLASQSRNSVVLQTEAGRIISVPKSKLSAADREWLNSKEAEATMAVEDKGIANSFSGLTDVQDLVSPKTISKPLIDSSTDRAGRVLQTLKPALARSNRGVERVRVVSISEKEVRIQIAINDNVIESLIKAGGKKDIRDCLKAIAQSALTYEKLQFDLTFPLVDKLGNSEEGKVAELTYSRIVVDKINWSNFIFGDVFDITDSIWLHPAF